MIKEAGLAHRYSRRVANETNKLSGGRGARCVRARTRRTALFACGNWQVAGRPGDRGADWRRATPGSYPYCILFCS